MKTFLIRHGATWANEQVPYILQGRSMDLSLSENGIKQAEKTALFISKKQVSRIYSSPLKRAIETSTIIAKVCGVSIEIVDNLIECNLGVWEQMSWDDIKAKYSVDYQWFISGDRAYLKGESYNDVLERIKPFFQELSAQKEDAVVVAHGIVNKAYLAHLLKIPLYLAKDLPQNNCAINTIYDTGELTINNIEHLY